MISHLGIWAGSSPAKKTEFSKGLKILRSFGLNLVIPGEVARYATVRQSSALSFLAGPDEKKIRSLESLWRNPKVEKIMAVRGGAGSLRLLRFLETAKFLQKQEKEIWGFSDLTSIQNFLFFKYGYSWVHSPMVTSNALLEANSVEKKAWRALVSGKKRTDAFILKKLVGSGNKSSRPLRGKIFGGNLSCLTTLAGGPWDRARVDNKILFLEEVNERDYRVDRVLTHLSYSRMFQNVEAVVLGHFTNCPKSGLILCEWAKRTGVALYAGLKSGHDRPNLPLTMGVGSRIELTSQNSAVLELPAPSWR